jgi:hypothetical protein
LGMGSSSTFLHTFLSPIVTFHVIDPGGFQLN